MGLAPLRFAMLSSHRRQVVAVCGPSGRVSDELQAEAREVGRLLAEGGFIVATGGLDGVMEAASRGAREGRGTTLGVLPSADPSDGNPYVMIAIACGNGQQRNSVLVQSADVVVAIGTSHGTLSEVALALRLGRPVVALHGYGPDIDESIRVVRDPGHAVHVATELAAGIA